MCAVQGFHIIVAQVPRILLALLHWSLSYSGFIRNLTMWTSPILILTFWKVLFPSIVYLPETSHGLVYLLLASLLALWYYYGYLFILYSYITIFCGQLHDRPFFEIITLITNNYIDITPMSFSSESLCSFQQNICF